MRASRREVRQRTPRLEGRRSAAAAAALLIALPLAFSPAAGEESAPDTSRAAAEVSATTSKPAEVSATTAKAPEVSATTAKADGATAPAKAVQGQGTAAKSPGTAATRAANASKSPASSKSASAPKTGAAEKKVAPGVPPSVGPAKPPLSPSGAAARRNSGPPAPSATRAAATKPSVTQLPAQSSAPSVVAVRPVPPRPSPVEDRVNYQYNALGRRDPFQPLVGGGFVSADVTSAPPDVGGLKVVGIIWGAEDKFALIEDPRGNSMVLRKGDKVMNGVVDNLRRDAVVVKLTVDGSTDLVEIPLTRKGESNENR